jgi:hypothetical protein
MISKQAIDKFKEIWKSEFGEDISDEHALEQGTNLLNLMRIVHSPIKKEWLDSYNAKLKEQQAMYPKKEKES